MCACGHRLDDYVRGGDVGTFGYGERVQYIEHLLLYGRQ